MKAFSMSYSVATIMSFLKNDCSMNFQSGEMFLVGPRHTTFEVVIIHQLQTKSQLFLFIFHISFVNY